MFCIIDKPDYLHESNKDVSGGCGVEKINRNRDALKRFSSNTKTQKQKL